MTQKQELALIALAKVAARGEDPSRLIGRKTVPVRTLEVLRRAGYVEPAGDNDNPYTGVWRLTPIGEERVRELISATKGPAR